MTRPRIDVLYDAETIAARVRALAAEIHAAGFRENVLVVAILKGGFVFAADLIRGHGGRLELARSDADGTEFLIHLPKAIGAAA